MPASLPKLYPCLFRQCHSEARARRTEDEKTEKGIGRKGRLQIFVSSAVWPGLAPRVRVLCVCICVSMWWIRLATFLTPIAPCLFK